LLWLATARLGLVLLGCVPLVVAATRNAQHVATLSLISFRSGTRTPGHALERTNLGDIAPASEGSSREFAA